MNSIENSAYKRVELYEGDCLRLMCGLEDKSVDMICCDLPYGTTVCKWDTVIPFEELWRQYNRVIKDNGAIVLFGSEPFTSRLIMSNLEMFKYNWYWNKKSSSGFVNAKLKPMGTIETISVFSKGKTSNGNQNNMPYFPQGLLPYNKVTRRGNKESKENTFWRPSTKDNCNFQEWTNYPKNYLEFAYQKKAVHPCQKPVDLLEYLVKTYTREGEVVLDNCMGSGSCGVACVHTGRSFIGMEKESKYFQIACHRIKDETLSEDYFIAFKEAVSEQENNRS